MFCHGIVKTFEYSALFCKQSAADFACAVDPSADFHFCFPEGLPPPLDPPLDYGGGWGGNPCTKIKKTTSLPPSRLHPTSFEYSPFFVVGQRKPANIHRNLVGPQNLRIFIIFCHGILKEKSLPSCPPDSTPPTSFSYNGRAKAFECSSLSGIGKGKPSNIQHFVAMGERKPSNIHHFFAMGE